MENKILLTASDGHQGSAYQAVPTANPPGGIVVIQEVFGVNSHIRRVCDSYAQEGYRVVAPALFDRLQRDVELGYDDKDLARGRELRTALGWEKPLVDVAAAVAHLKPYGKVGVLGFCWGASVTWLSATRLAGVDCAVCYYGAQIVDFCEEQPRSPVLLHFGETDPLIPQENVERIRKAHPGLPLYLYPAGHGFNCDARADYHPESAALARERTLTFFRQHLG